MQPQPTIAIPALSGMKRGEVTQEMLEVGMWVLAGYISPGEMKHVDQQALLCAVYRAMRTTEGDLVAAAEMDASPATSAASS
jgi:hypothetical protein